MLSGLLYRLSYQPAKSRLAKPGDSSPRPTPKAFGAALPTELPTRKRLNTAVARSLNSRD